MRGQFDLDRESSQHQQEEVGQRRWTSRFLKFTTMARLWSSGIMLAIIFIVILGIFAESFTVTGQKAKSKVVVKRRKVTTTTVAPVRPSPPLPVDRIVVTESPRRAKSVEASLISENATVVTPCPAGCDLDKCPTDLSCPSGMVRDRCECCNVCSVGEGSRCHNVTEPTETVGAGDGICGPGLLCSARMDLQPGESFEALCECRNKQSVCGTNNISYSSECKLREAAHLNRKLTIASWSSCVTAPWVTTPMENVTVGAIGHDLSVSCEFKAFPAPMIYWEFYRDGSSDRVVLPGDDSSIIQTHRGGPEELMTTTWLQIISASPKHQGSYHCVAKNSEGTATSYGTVSVYNEHHDEKIPASS